MLTAAETELRNTSCTLFTGNKVSMNARFYFIASALPQDDGIAKWKQTQSVSERPNKLHRLVVKIKW